MKIASIFLSLFVATSTLFAQQPADKTYTDEIRKQTTDPHFMTELVDHLPASATVPSPLAFNGYIAGAEGHLTYAEDVARYMRALEKVSPRVKVFSAGNSEEEREMIVVAISDAETIAHLDRYRDITAKLADPRTLGEADAEKLIADGKPMYWATGAMHSPETGSPEMQMELAYRLVAEETPFIQAIRKNVIVLLTPVLEVDGRDRQVDLWNYRKAHPEVPTPPLVYWGHYVAHDNNRDQIGMALALSKNVSRMYFEFHPQVVHDLHESIPFLYISTGTGPYNPALDPLVIDEWQRMAYHEVDELTERGLPGVWTHGFYDGWAPNYMFWVGIGHNSIGRFYETFGNRWPITAKRIVRGMSDRAWFRPNPPLPQITWSFRDNINYQQSGLLFALSYMANNRAHFLKRFYELGKRAIAKAVNEGPAAYVLEGDQKRQGELANLLDLLRRQGIEIQVADSDFSIEPEWPPKAAASEKEGTANAKSSEDEGAKKEGKGAKKEDKKPEPLKFAKGSYIVRMDQPYSRLADTFLDIQYVRSDEQVYDDTGWTLGYLKNVSVRRIVNRDVLDVKMHPWTGDTATRVPAGFLIIANHADVDLAVLRFAAPKANLLVAETSFKISDKEYPAGTVLSNSTGIEGVLSRLHLSITPVKALPEVETHPLEAPRIGLIHTWLDTQAEGWWRLALESMGVPYDYLSTQTVAATSDLRAKYDVLLFPPAGDDPIDVVNGLPPGPALPWKKTDLTPNLGRVDSTDDMRPGLGLQGVQNLQRFVEGGGLLVTARDTSELAVQYGLARWVRVVNTNRLKATGTVLKATVIDHTSPIVAGYDETLPVYFSRGPVFEVGAVTSTRESPRPSGRGGKDDPDVPQGRPFVETPEQNKPAPGEEGFQEPEDAPWNYEVYTPKPEDRPRVIAMFAKGDKLPLSGMLDGGEELADKPAVIDAPLGKGHIILMSINPMWRATTQGQYALVMNAVMNWNRLR
jgi:hypothetical protein